MIVVYILGLFAVVICAGFIVALLDIANEANETWQKNVRAEDLKELGKSIKN